MALQLLPDIVKDQAGQIHLVAQSLQGSWLYAFMLQGEVRRLSPELKMQPASQIHQTCACLSICRHRPILTVGFRPAPGAGMGGQWLPSLGLDFKA